MTPSETRHASARAGRTPGPEIGPDPAEPLEIGLTINGETRAVRAGSTVADVLHTLDLDPRAVIVEHNREILRDRGLLGTRCVAAGDELEIVHFVGGG